MQTDLRSRVASQSGGHRRRETVKTGSTSLHHYLGRHPDVFMSREKEVRFFSDHFEKGDGWYRDHFRDGGAFTIRGETSPQYSAFPQFSGVPQRMHGLIPDAKLIYIVRDPLPRLWSHFAFVTPVSDPEEFRRALTPLDYEPLCRRKPSVLATGTVSSVLSPRENPHPDHRRNCVATGARALASVCFVSWASTKHLTAANGRSS